MNRFSKLDPFLEPIPLGDGDNPPAERIGKDPDWDNYERTICEKCGKIHGQVLHNTKDGSLSYFPWCRDCTFIHGFKYNLITEQVVFGQEE